MLRGVGEQQLEELLLLLQHQGDTNEQLAKLRVGCLGGLLNTGDRLSGRNRASIRVTRRGGSSRGALVLLGLMVNNFKVEFAFAQVKFPTVARDVILTVAEAAATRILEALV